MIGKKFIAVGVLLLLMMCQTGCALLPEANSTPTLQIKATQPLFPTETPTTTETPIPAITQRSAIPSPTLIPFTLDSVNEEISLSIWNAKEIIEGLELFFNGEGYYPDNLDLLVPKYLETIPLTFTLNAYEYNLSNPDTYILYFNVSRAGERWNCGYLRASELWDCSGNGSLEHDSSNPNDIEGLYDEENLLGYMNYPGDLSAIYDTIVIHYRSDYDNLDVRAVQEVEMKSRFYDIGCHFIIGQDGTIFEGRDIAIRGNQSFPNYGRIGILWLSDSSNKDKVPSPVQYDATVQLIEWLDSSYGIDFLYGCKGSNGLEIKCLGDNALPHVEELNKIVTH